MPALLRYSKWRRRPDRGLVVGRFYIHDKLVKRTIALETECRFSPDGTPLPATTRLLARRWEAAFAELSAQAPPRPAPGLLFAQAATEFLASQRQVRRPGTVALQEKTVERFRGLVGNLPLALVDRKAVETFRHGLQAGGRLRPVSINLELRNLRSLLNWCVRAGLLEAAPYVEMVKHTRQSVSPASRQQVADAWALADARRRLAPPSAGRGRQGSAEIGRHAQQIRRARCHARLLFNLSLGMRRSEAAFRLQADYLLDDLKNAWALVRDNAYMQVKESEAKRYPLTPAQALWMRAELAETPGWTWACQGHDIPPRPLWRDGNAVSQTLRVSYGLRASAVRKAVASGALDAGADPLAVSALLGHSQIRTTDRHYLQSRDPLKRRAAGFSPFGTLVEPKKKSG